jgi:hypothetical protein
MIKFISTKNCLFRIVNLQKLRLKMEKTLAFGKKITIITVLILEINIMGKRYIK